MTNETLKTLETRRSCRDFKPDMITDEELETVIRAGTFAPSGKNQQSAIIIAVTNKELRDQIMEENRKSAAGRKASIRFTVRPSSSSSSPTRTRTTQAAPTSTTAAS